MYYVVKYTGPFGFIKPWTAVRDGETFSQQFLTPSIIKGIELKLFPELLDDLNKTSDIQKIKRHRLSYDGLSRQQEQIQPKDFIVKNRVASRQKSILWRGIMIEPVLHLAFDNLIDAQRASLEHICLCRNEDLLFPNQEIEEMDENKFEELNGFELLFEKDDDAFMVGFNRFSNAEPMYGKFKINQN
jgi:hypothetical protein